MRNTKWIRRAQWCGLALVPFVVVVASQPELMALVTPGFIATAIAYEGAATSADEGRLRAARIDKVQGVTISTHRIGLEWGTEIIGPTLDHISSVGANWVAIHPYASIRDDGSVNWERFDPDDYAESIRRPIREAHRRGLKILVKPHLAYWGSGFSWRGEIDFPEPIDLARFFAEYRKWTVELAKLAKDADAFSVGCELDRLLHHETQWREMIEEVRAVTSAPLTYAANWPDYQKVGFWDALDAIGIQAYFPLSDAPNPSQKELEHAWAVRMRTLREYSKAQKRTIVFTELGYNRSTDAARMPWDYRVDRAPRAAELQARCMRVALAAVDSEPSVVGSFLWKWFPEPYPNGRTYALATDEMKSLICERWCLPTQPATNR